MKNDISQIATSGHPATADSFVVIFVSLSDYLGYNLADVSF